MRLKCPNNTANTKFMKFPTVSQKRGNAPPLRYATIKDEIDIISVTHQRRLKSHPNELVIKYRKRSYS